MGSLSICVNEPSKLLCFSSPCRQLWCRNLNWKSNKRSLTCFSSQKKIGFMDQILDYIEGLISLLYFNLLLIRPNYTVTHFEWFNSLICA